MAIEDTVRPASSAGLVGFSAVGGAYPAVLADDSDATYMTSSTVASAMSMFMDSHTPTADYGRHRYRIRIRWQHFSGTFSPFADIAARINVQPPQPTSPTVPHNWLNAPSIAMGIEDLAMPYELIEDSILDTLAILPAAYVQRNNNGGGGSSVMRVMETYIDIDTRHIPAFTPDVIDGAGVSVSGGTIADTNRPRLTFTAGFSSIDYDNLTARTWTVEIIDTVSTDTVYSGSGSGTPAAVISTVPLPNGSYQARFQVTSTIRTNTAHASDVETIDFDIAFVPPNPPDVTVTPTADPPSVEVCWSDPSSPGASPGDTEWDDPDAVVVEVRRTDCNGTTTIYVAEEYEGCHVDRFASLSNEGQFCDDPGHECEVCYEARWWGLVDDILVTTEWSASSPGSPGSPGEPCVSLDNPTPGNDWIHGAASGDMSICPDRTYTSQRPFGVFQPIGGGYPVVTTGAPGGRDYTLRITVESEADLVALEAILAQPLVYYQPADAADQWMAPQAPAGEYPKVYGVRTLTVSLVAVEGQPIVDPESFFA